MPWNEVSRAAQRLRLVLAIMSRREPVADICHRFGVSRQTGYKFLARFREQGRKGLQERSRRPARSGWPARWKRQIVRMRRKRPTWGGGKLRWWLRQRHRRRHLPAERTIQRWLAASGLVRRRTHKRHGMHARPRTLAARRCNDVWTVDFKGWFLTRRGQRIEPLTVRDLHSRYLLAVVPVASTAAREVRRVFRRLFARHGLPRVIRSDRGSPFCGTGPHGLTQLGVWWHRLGIRMQFVDRQRGIDNNAHEQMHAVLQAEVARKPARTLRAQNGLLQAWRRHYNHARPHEALGMCTPASRYHSGKRRAPRLRLPHYPAGWLVRRGQKLRRDCGRRKTLRHRPGVSPAARRPKTGQKPPSSCVLRRFAAGPPRSGQRPLPCA